ncbi:DUF6612 family protein [Fusobacterium pseudoperiodonticum]|uniref:DUF6612 family protein n=1 Tax=Fusobacterium pseudoperiodonticum TaxID=2663009 RepID=UPI0028EA7429|nr:DUF6612 family protein [Fusobacterium pseudoperiodonticum]
MKKSLKKILFTILTVFAVFFVVACGNKEDAKINKEEVLQKNVEATNSIKSGRKVINAKVEVEGGQPIEYIVDSSLIKEPLAMKTILEAKEDNIKITTFIKDGVMYTSYPEDNSWLKLDISEKDMNKFKIILNDSIEIYKVLKDNLDKISIKEDDENYIISITKNSDFINEYIKNSMSNTMGQNTDLKANNATLEYIIDKETYFTKSFVLTFDAEVQGQKLKALTETTFSDINNVEEIIVPEEALNSNN